MKVSALAFLLLLLVSETVLAENVVVLGGKPYNFSLSEATLKDCTKQEQLDEMLNSVGVIRWTVKVGMAEAACKIKCRADGKSDEYCNDFCLRDPGQVKHNIGLAMDMIFDEFRNYPPYTKHPFCEQGRQACEKKCNQTAVFSAKECGVKCNQYEKYNSR